MWKTEDATAHPTNACGCFGLCKKRTSRGVMPSGPSSIVCVIFRFFQLQMHRLLPYRSESQLVLILKFSLNKIISAN